MRSYSVPVRFIDGRLTMHLTSDMLVAFESRREIAGHIGLADRGLEYLVLDRYLEVLLRKPGALDRSEALHQARAQGACTAEHEAFWALAKQQLGESDWTNSPRRILLLPRYQRYADVIAGLRAAIALGTCSEDVAAWRRVTRRLGRRPRWSVTRSAFRHL
ncbi:MULTISPECIES: hypothetical protein [unclassified Streptomyces]|uniref:hypothetical protein n=1 Tax=unclassified Streptomyces TaxID=2593676 RepID=UPI0024736C58|nr:MULTISPECIES: hypothetical protein [unclassified Streptomyces]MDH6455726.1 hypothetical protein [Streptomyces sp. SAI-119]MDH6502345.1 hypothetical protein [Streptomyces sp. SAI-149]